MLFAMMPGTHRPLAFSLCISRENTLKSQFGEKTQNNKKNLGQIQTDRVNYASLMLIDVELTLHTYYTLRGIYLHINTSFPAIHTISAIPFCLEYLIMLFCPYILLENDLSALNFSEYN
jgi:hypothetical protein